ncbi:MAG: quinone oxidoreductase [Nevskia sp.]|nr:quinone oxidoreductase [Nevskia sp.]
MPLRAIIDRTGGPEVIRFVQTEPGQPGPGEVRIRHTAVGLNMIDTYHRTGVYRLALPSGLGMEAAGVVVALGPSVQGLAVGDRVAYAALPLGAYCEERLFKAEHLVRLPAGVADEAAAAVILKGMTAYYLLHLTYAVKPGHSMLVYAAAGGVGSLLVPWARHLGATVIGAVGSPAKAALARELGCHHVIDYSRQDIAAEVRRITAGAGVDVVYDSVGKDSFAASLNSLKRRGLLVSYGNSSGKVPPFEPALLSDHGSLFFTRPTLGHYTATRQELEQAAGAVFAAIAQGIVTVKIGQRYSLQEAARAHADLEARRTTGATVLLP